MRRVIGIVGVWLALLVLGAWGYATLAGDAAAVRGARRYVYRESLKRQLASAQAARPGVVWLGDSTILGVRAVSYPQILGGVLPDESSSVIGFLGADFFTYYPLVGELLAVHRPAVVVMVAHLRLFRKPTSAATRNDLLSMIPLQELPRATRLPLVTRGMTIPRLLLVRLLRYEAVERALYVVEGARAQLSEANFEWLGPNELVPPGAGFMALGKALVASDVDVDSEHPTVRMMAATVRLARTAGVRVIVVGTPIPFEAMRDSVGYDRALYASRFAVLRRAVENAGGLYVDLHEALPAERFGDAVGHFDAAGAQLLADRLRPIVERELHRAE